MTNLMWGFIQGCHWFLYSPKLQAWEVGCIQ